jgi:hypothetical protein
MGHSHEISELTGIGSMKRNSPPMVDGWILQTLIFRQCQGTIQKNNPKEQSKRTMTAKDDGKGSRQMAKTGNEVKE